MGKGNGKAAITWTTEQRRLGDLLEWEPNPRQLSEHGGKHLRISLEKFGLVEPLVININPDRLVGGHQRKHIMQALKEFGPDALVDVRVPSRQLTAEEHAELAIRLNKNTGAWDFDVLANNFSVGELEDWGFTEKDLQISDAFMPDFQPVDESEQPRLDQKKPVICPECGAEFTPK